jgi:hypothetical protein
MGIHPLFPLLIINWILFGPHEIDAAADIDGTSKGGVGKYLHKTGHELEA